MRTKSGILELGKREQEALKVVKEQVEKYTDFNKSVLSKKIEKGINVIDFILQITK